MKVIISSRTHHISIMKLIQLMAFRKIIVVHSDNHLKQTHTLPAQSVEFFNIHQCGIYYYHCIFFSTALPAYSGPRTLIQFRNHFSQRVGHLERVISPSKGHYLNTGQHKHRINSYTHQTSMTRVGF
jgi:hypothetical protein